MYIGSDDESVPLYPTLLMLIKTFLSVEKKYDSSISASIKPLPDTLTGATTLVPTVKPVMSELRPAGTYRHCRSKAPLVPGAEYCTTTVNAVVVFQSDGTGK